MMMITIENVLAFIADMVFTQMILERFDKK